MRPIVASDLMNPDVVTVEEDRSLKELANFLIDYRIAGYRWRRAYGVVLFP